MTIRLKIIIIVLSLLAVLGLAFFTYAITATATYQRIRMDAVSQSVAIKSEKINKLIARMEQNVLDLANAGEMLLLADPRPDRIAEALVVENFTAFPVAVGGGIWYEPNRFHPGVARAAFYAFRDAAANSVHIDRNFSGAAYDYHTQDWYRKIASDTTRPGTDVNASFWVKPYFDDTGTRVLMTTVGSAIYDPKGHFAGMATVDWQIQGVIDEAASIHPTPNSFVVLSAPQDDYVISNTRVRSAGGAGGALKTIPWLATVKRPSEGGAVTVDSLSIDGRSYFVFSRFMDNGWLLSVPTPADEIFAELEARNMRYAYGFGILALCILAIAYILLSRLVSAPIGRLIKQVEEVGAGNLDVRVDPGSNDEIGRLAAAFNQLTENLRAAQKRRYDTALMGGRLRGEEKSDV